SRRTLSSWVRQSMASQSRAASSGPFTCMGVQRALRFRWSGYFVVKGSPAHVSLLYAAGHQARYPPSYYWNQPVGGPATRFHFPLAFQPAALCFWGVLFPPGLGSPYGRLTTAPWGVVDLDGCYHVPHTRDAAGSGALCIPEATVSPRS